MNRAIAPRHPQKPRSALSIVVAGGLLLMAGGCIGMYVFGADAGIFRVLGYEADGTLVVQGTKGREHTVKLYGVKVKGGWKERVAAAGPAFGPRFILINGGATMVEKEGRLVYNRKAVGSRAIAHYSPNIVEADGVTPTQDKDGRILAIASTCGHPLLGLQEMLISQGVAEPDPDIVGDPFVDFLREYALGLKRPRKWDP